MKINAAVLHLAKRAYATTWHEEETDAWIRWVAVAVRRHLDRSSQERGEAAAPLPAAPAGPPVPCMFRLEADLVAALDVAVEEDASVRGTKPKRSPWLVEALRMATLETERAWHGLDDLDRERLPWPPARSGLLG